MNWFLSKFCPDFSAIVPEAEKLRRPFSVNSQCAKLLAILEAGETLTVRKAMAVCGGTEASRRIRDVKTYLHQEGKGRKLTSEWIKTAKGARIKQWRLEA